MADKHLIVVLHLVAERSEQLALYQNVSDSNPFVTALNLGQFQCLNVAAIHSVLEMSGGYLCVKSTVWLRASQRRSDDMSLNSSSRTKQSKSSLSKMTGENIKTIYFKQVVR